MLRIAVIGLVDIGNPDRGRVAEMDRCAVRAGKARARRHRFREVARAAGVPDTIWNMDARAGAVTDAYDKGAREVDAMDLGTHTQLATNRRYSRNRLAATSRVAVLRFGGKNEPGKGGA